MKKLNWREQLEAVEKRFAVVEAEAEKVVGELAARGAATRKELEELVQKVKAGELASHAAELRSRAEKTGTEVLQKLQPQVAELGRELKILGRKLEKFGRPRSEKPEA